MNELTDSNDFVHCTNLRERTEVDDCMCRWQKSRGADNRKWIHVEAQNFQW